MSRPSLLQDDPLWYKDAIFYEVRVRSFYDCSGDGIGDFPGLTAKLDYLRELGVTAVWLLPFYPSPLRDDGYDISDYLDVHPDCGTLRDFKIFLREAHRHGLRVVTELVLNHTSDQHPWFQRARRAAKDDPARDFYVWSDTAERYKEARVIFEDFEPSNWSWDPVARAYYWHRFFAHQPDLNFENPAVRKAIFKVLDFWLAMGIDGFRLDAVPYLFEREGTSCENLPETHAFLRELRAHVDHRFRNRMLLAEANQWPEDAVTFMAGGKECHMAFHFPLMPRIFIAVRMEDRFPLTDVWAQTPAIEESCQWALFLRNHDELTLETVTDEERDYMYRAYAQESRMRVNLGIRRRLAPLLGNNRRSIELVNGLLMSLPGTPIIYYGDEIGMGDNIHLGDRDGVRTPMQWSGDRNAGFSRGDPQRLILPVIIDYEYHYQTVNVEAQERNRHSLLWWTRRLVALRKQYKAFGRGSIEFLTPDNPRVLAFIRSYGDERILVVANLSRFVQYVQLDLARYKGMTPVELFGTNRFPAIGEQPLMLTLGPHMFDWFSLEAPRLDAMATVEEYEPPRIGLTDSLERLIQGQRREIVERALPAYFRRCTWLGAKAGMVKNVRIIEAIPLAENPNADSFVLVNLEFSQGEAETYTIPLGLADARRFERLHLGASGRPIARIERNGRNAGSALDLVDLSTDVDFMRLTLDLIARRRRVKGQRGELAGFTLNGQAGAASREFASLEGRALRGDSNSSVAFGNRLVVKLFRRLEGGDNPEVEIGRYLAAKSGFALAPPLVGWLEYRPVLSEPYTAAVLHGHIPNQGDALEYSRGELMRYFERAATRAEVVAPPARISAGIAEVEAPAEAVVHMVGAYLDAARLMGRRVAELHLALASDSADPEFAPQPFSLSWQRSVYQSMRNLAGLTLRLLRSRQPLLPAECRGRADRLVARWNGVLQPFELFIKRPITAARIRCHGDLRLSQLLNTGKDFVIIDFEGEAWRPLSERRRKRTAIRDVATMLQSFRNASTGILLEQTHSGTLGGRDFAAMEPWARLWESWTAWAFLKEYLTVADRAPFVPDNRTELRVLIGAYLLERALSDLAYELTNRPGRAAVALRGVESVLEATSGVGL